ncbi:MAG: GNAT family N-acetyltransferase [Candidatus Riflebacteria bacterium]|nr:GNAT family N-acetyltransferase [Candidatus Riflebacteria bacterium]
MDRPRELLFTTLDDAGLWDRFVERCPRGSRFASSPWVESCCLASKSRRRIIGACRGDTLIGGLAVAETGFGALRSAWSVPLTPYGGLLTLARQQGGHCSLEDETLGFSAGLLPALTHQLLCRYVSIDLVHSPPWPDARPFLWAGWQVEPRYVSRVGLTSSDQAWSTLSSRAKDAVRAAVEAGFRYHRSAGFEAFWHLSRVGPGRRDARLPAALEQHLHAMGELGVAWSAQVVSPAGDPVAAAILVDNGNTLSALRLAFDRSVPGTGCEFLLVWGILEDSASRFQSFELLAEGQSESVALERDFGGQVVPYLRSRVTRRGPLGLAITGARAVYSLAGRCSGVPGGPGARSDG